MVMCSMDNVPRPPALPPGGRLEAVPETASLRGSPGFRLLDDQDTGSVYSVYKQKIDAMFESDSSSNTKNSVQVQLSLTPTRFLLTTVNFRRKSNGCLRK